MFVPSIVSEREAGQWEDCVPCSGVMLENALRGADVHPATRAEYEGLRRDATGVAEASGDGMKLAELGTGLNRRYSRESRRGGGWPSLLAATPVGTATVVQGSTSGFPARLQEQGPGIAHCVLFARDRDLSGLILDPLKPNGAAPERATLDELRAFHETLPGSEWLVGTYRRIPSMAISIRRQLGDVAIDAAFYDVPGGERVGKFSRAQTVEVVGVPMDQSPDRLNLGWRAVEVTTQAIDGRMAEKVVYLPTEAIANLRDPLPDTSGDAEAARLAGAQGEWDRWHAGLGIPDRPTGGA